VRVPRREPPRARIEIIPMIDVIFFLLVFFMVSTLSMTINRGLPVNLPTAASSQKELREHLNLTLTQAGEMFLNKEPVALEDLGTRVRAALAGEPALMVIITADGDVRHQAVVEAMDALRLAGVARLAIAVRPDRKAQP
jgi:biopolymer transport protein ExbD